MTKAEYSIALQDIRWKRKRLIILERDKHMCQTCRCKTNLHVHHKWYIKDKQPWEVPDNYLIVLCARCHEKVHKNRQISSFIRKAKPKKSRRERRERREARKLLKNKKNKKNK